MTVTLQVRIETRSLERIDADLAVAGFFFDERPLRGPAGRADWRLCGAISDLVASGKLRGKLGEAVLVPSFGRLGADRVLLLGLGRRSSFRAGRAREAGAEAMGRGLGLRAARVAIAPPLLGTAQLARHVDALLLGVLDAMDEAERPMSLSLVVPPEDGPAALRSAGEVVDARREVEVTLVDLTAQGARTSRPQHLS